MAASMSEWVGSLCSFLSKLFVELSLMVVSLLLLVLWLVAPVLILLLLLLWLSSSLY